MMQSIGQLKRASRVNGLRRLWVGCTWIRLHRSKRNWFQHDYLFIRTEARKTGLM